MIDQTVFENKTAAYYTLGCKLNFAETSAIGKQLLNAGVSRSRRGQKADICVINTCSVTDLQIRSASGNTQDDSVSSGGIYGCDRMLCST